MTAVFTRTARSSATESYVHAGIAIVVGTVFIALPVFLTDLPTAASIGSLAVSTLCFLWALALARAARAYTKSGLDWRVEVSGSLLSWQSPLEKVMASFSVPLSNIKLLRQIKTRRSGKGAGFRSEFIIELTRGDAIKLPENVPGIDPAEVFEALESAGVRIEREEYLTRSDVIDKHRKRLAEKRLSREQTEPEASNAVAP